MGVMDLQDRYLDLAALSEYSALSVKQLRRFLRDPVRPLPCFRPGGDQGKILVRRGEFDAWMESHRSRENVDVGRIVDEVMASVRG